MQLAIAEPDTLAADVLAYAASRRGHQAMSVPTPERLLGNLPFAPSALIISLRTLDEAAVARLKAVRSKFPEATIFIVSGRAKPAARMATLELGVSDIVKAPCAPHELILRVESWDRARSDDAAPGSALSIGDLEVDLYKYAVKKNDTAVVLTRLELRLLYCLCEHFPHLAPTERLLTFGWEGMEEPDASLIKTHISHIRKKLGEAGGTPVEIRSRQGVGYIMSVSTA